MEQSGKAQLRESSGVVPDYEAILRRFADAYDRRDLDAVLEVYHADAELITILDGIARGHEAIAEAVREQWEMGDMRVEMHGAEYLGEGRVLSWGEFIVCAEGMEQRQELGGLFDFRGERVIRARAFPSLEEARRAAAE